MTELDLYDQLCIKCQDLLDQKSEPVLGDNLDPMLEGQVALDTVLIKTSKVESVQINATRSGARPPFGWLYEITFRGEPFQHYLLLENSKIVETYGKNVTPVSAEKAKKLYDQMLLLSHK